MFGRVTRRNICQPLAPSEIAASSSSEPCSCISGISSRATNGKVMNMVASTMPGTAKMIFTPCSMSHGPNTPCAPKSKTKISPEITGDTAKGRSISVTRRFLPGNSKRAIAQAAATPKTAFAGTEIPATIRVSLIACSATGSLIAFQYTPRPAENASTNTATRGRSRNSAAKPRASTISAARTSGGSSSAARTEGGAFPCESSSAAIVTVPRPRRRVAGGRSLAAR